MNGAPLLIGKTTMPKRKKREGERKVCLLSLHNEQNYLKKRQLSVIFILHTSSTENAA